MLCSHTCFPFSLQFYEQSKSSFPYSTDEKTGIRGSIVHFPQVIKSITRRGEAKAKPSLLRSSVITFLLFWKALPRQDLLLSKLFQLFFMA